MSSSFLEKFLPMYKRKFNMLIKVSIFVLYNVYLGFAIYTTWNQSKTYCEGVKFLTIITIISYIFLFNSYILKPFLLQQIQPCLLPFVGCLKRIRSFKHASKIAWSFVLVSIGVFLVMDTTDERYRLVPAGGLFIFILFGYLFSKHRSHIVWSHVLWGVTIQFFIGLIILRWPVGRDAFECLGDKIKNLLDVTDKGTTFVFGYLVDGDMVDIPKQPPILAFKCFTVVIFFSFIVSLLYYYGIIQILVVKLGWVLHKTMGTTACESLNAAANIFLGMNEAPLLIRPFLKIMTKSELHAVMTGGFATLAGSGLSFYISFGISATHLLTASVMSAPAGLGIAKLMYPETEESQTKPENIKIEKGPEANALEAATNGSMAAVQLIANIIANIIAFIAFISFLDLLFGWFGSLILWNDLSFEWLMSKIFVPVSLLMGADWDDREQVANLIGIKTVVNEFVGYNKLLEYQKLNMISERSAALATYALCGFSNIASIGIQLGTLSALAPERKSDLAQIAVRSMIAGTVTCLVTACVAGTLIKH